MLSSKSRRVNNFVFTRFLKLSGRERSSSLLRDVFSLTLVLIPVFNTSPLIRPLSMCTGQHLAPFFRRTPKCTRSWSRAWSGSTISFRAFLSQINNSHVCILMMVFQELFCHKMERNFHCPVC